mmetsp:Transcript_18668/g.30682  ORF Transcript_18668/g.30682 Transcript_18668/m.30682 type:complete len:171 (+) Transcript_18668:241-753(+)|eukprot:CAMPEP_0184647146 /NCGR_PEP_ID=MMETSP0308-20130426/4058_1 /TAXON_ID=38269 /ORGANISM="Gloeochaete witrockiana, Strain SAG 46.84" /LENGTH=170 /DNA_ID=CAMNT_0027077913 /DNA_START=224 /DNA_END=736 /DNA_ORIENTATION=-
MYPAQHLALSDLSDEMSCDSEELQSISENVSLVRPDFTELSDENNVDFSDLDPFLSAWRISPRSCICPMSSPIRESPPSTPRRESPITEMTYDMAPIVSFRFKEDSVFSAQAHSMHKQAFNDLNEIRMDASLERYVEMRLSDDAHADDDSTLAANNEVRSHAFSRIGLAR